MSEQATDIDALSPSTGEGVDLERSQDPGQQPCADANALAPARAEPVARLVYGAMRWAAENAEKKAAPVWVDGGNSFVQDEARHYATKILDLLRGADQ